MSMTRMGMMMPGPYPSYPFPVKYAFKVETMKLKFSEFFKERKHRECKCNNGDGYCWK